MQQVLEQSRPVEKDTFSRTIDEMDWSGFFPLGNRKNLCRPHDEEEVRSLVRSASGTVRPIGSRLSQFPLLRLDHSDDLLLDLNCLRGVMGVYDDSVTFGAATNLDEVYRFLAGIGRMLPCCPGVISLQTLAGALATGTHGQGIQQSSFAETVIRLRIVLSDGSVTDVDASHPWFAAALLSLGALGIVTQVTLRTVPICIYTCTKRTFPDSDLERDLSRWIEEQDHTKAWWYPEDHQIHVWQAGPATEEETNRYNIAGRKLTAISTIDTTLNNAVARSLARMREDIRNDGTDKPFKTLERFRNVSDVTGDLFQVFCNGIAAPQINLEIALPFDRIGRIIHKLREMYQENPNDLHYPVILRCTGPSDAWLSPTHNEAVCYFGFVVYYDADRSISERGLAFLRSVEKMLAGEGGRPHWGKYFNPLLYDWAALYANWENFRKVRAMADLKGKFLNHYLRGLLGATA